MQHSIDRYLAAFITAGIWLVQTACEKDWLAAKSHETLRVPYTLTDFQLLLDNSDGLFNINGPAIGEMSSDDLVLSAQTFYNLPTLLEKNIYTWEKDNLYANSTTLDDWNSPYEQVLNANIVLDGLATVSPTAENAAAYNNVLGSALFFRSFSFFAVAGLFCPPYHAATAATDLGIPLRLHSDFNAPTTRSTVAATYAQIITDLEKAATLLPRVPAYPTRPSQAAAYALLSRVYLSMRRYEAAGCYAAAAIKTFTGSLLRFADLPANAATPFGKYNTEVLFPCRMMTYAGSNSKNFLVRPALYESYARGDLRKTCFFTGNNGNIYFKGSYAQSASILFYGIALDELYLTRAECLARSQQVAAGLDVLNQLLRTRWDPAVTYTPVTASDAATALQVILAERRKELAFRGLRWTDLRRLNQEAATATLLIRTVDSTYYTLQPGDNRYVFPIPPDVIQFTHIPQNIR